MFIELTTGELINIAYLNKIWQEGKKVVYELVNGTKKYEECDTETDAADRTVAMQRVVLQISQALMGKVIVVPTYEELQELTDVRENTLAVVYKKKSQSDFTGMYIFQDGEWNPVPNIFDAEPENLAPGYTVLGKHGIIVGTFTIDATAENSDMVAGKTAYVNGQKVVGTIQSANEEEF